MYVKILYRDDYGNFFRTSEVINPSWEDVLKTISKMEGDLCSSISLNKGFDNEGNEDMFDEYMGICGGENNIYIGFISTQNPDEQEWVLCSSQVRSDEFIEVMCGQPGSFPKDRCVGLEDILLAAETYFKFGKRSEKVLWRSIPR